jgi:sialic acid synthase SpsE
MKLPGGKTYIIAEAGQNHNGDILLAKQLIDMAAMPIFDKFNNRQLPSVNAIKFTKRDLSEELSVDEYNRPYNSPHSFGKTYGEHREFLELSYEQHAELENYARSKEMDFIETLTSIKTISLLKNVKVDAIKVASRDLTNLPLLEELARVGQKMIISTGMGDEKEIDKALEIITKHHDNVSILHCISQYPASYENIDLLAIPYLKEKYPYEIGFSDHSIGIVMAPVAVALGATIIEKHITLNRGMKGSDHQASLEPDGLWRMVRDIRNVEIALGGKRKVVQDGVRDFKLKLERSLASNRDIQEGETISEGDLCMLSPGNGLRWAERGKIIGKKVKHDIPRHTIILMRDVIDGNTK